MTNEELEKKIQKAFSDVIPDAKEGIMCEVRKGSGKAGFFKKKHMTKGNLIRTVSVAAAAAAAVAGISFGISSYTATTAVASTVSIDASPSLDIKVNKDRKVLSVTPGNEEAKDIIGTMDFKGTDIKVAVNAILGAMITKGYISEISNSILVSVDDSDPETAKELQDTVMSDIDKTIGQGVFKGAVIGQVLSERDEIYAMASEYGITPGKAQLIKQITDQNLTLKFDDLVSLSINDLNLLRNDINGISTIGIASDSAYIGSEEAVRTAMEFVGLDKEDTDYLKVDFDYENGAICYDVSFHNKEGDLDYDYDFDIDALTGEIISAEKELDNPDILVFDEDAPEKNTEEDALFKALEFAEVKKEDIFDYEFEEQRERYPHYDLEFKSGDMEYNYSVGIYDDTIFKKKWEKEELGDGAGEPDNTFKPSEEELKRFIPEDRAKEAALEQAGVLEAETYGMEIEIEKDKEKIIYEVEFKCGIFDYSYDVDCMTGEVVDYEIDFTK